MNGWVRLTIENIAVGRDLFPKKSFYQMRENEFD
jgi:hypothetical protein